MYEPQCPYACTYIHTCIQTCLTSVKIEFISSAVKPDKDHSWDQVTVASLDRWSTRTGGPHVQVVHTYRWSTRTGGPHVQVVHTYRWSTRTGGPHEQVVHMYRWFTRTDGPHVQVVHMYRWSTCTGGPHLQVVHTYRWSTRTGGPHVQVYIIVFLCWFLAQHIRRSRGPANVSRWFLKTGFTGGLRTVEYSSTPYVEVDDVKTKWQNGHIILHSKNLLKSYFCALT